MLLNPFELHRPQTITEAVRLIASLKDTKVLAGGTFLINNLKALKKKGLKTPQNVISLRNVGELKGLENKGDMTIVKAMATLNEMAAASYPKPLQSFAKFFREMATNTIRNMATIGGNLTCRYTWTEASSLMIALNAVLHFATTKGEKELPAEEFFAKGAKEAGLFTHVHFTVAPDTRLSYVRVTRRSQVDLPFFTVCSKAAVNNGKLKDPRVVVNNGRCFPRRDKKLEDFLEGEKIDSSLAQEALKHLDPVIFDENPDAYLRHISRVSLRNSIAQLIEEFKK